MAHEDGKAAGELERRDQLQRDQELDEALDQSFPASDPPAMVVRARDRRRRTARLRSRPRS